MFDTVTKGPAHYIRRGEVRLSPGAKIELDFWRGVIVLLFANPHFLGISIDALRIEPLIERWWYTDASSTIGFGGYLSLDNNGVAVAAVSGQWTRQELEAFAQLGVSINAHPRVLRSDILPPRVVAATRRLTRHHP